MPTDTRYTAALATAYDARGIPTMAQISALCGHKPLTVTDTAPSPSEARTMDSTRNAILPSDAERELYRLGRRMEAVRLYRERAGISHDQAKLSFRSTRYAMIGRTYARAEAAAAIVKMAKEAGIYFHLWRPEEIGITKAAQLIGPLQSALAAMKADPKRFEAHNSPNGWGLYENFVPFVEQYLAACEACPNADVSVSR